MVHAETVLELVDGLGSRRIHAVSVEERRDPSRGRRVRVLPRRKYQDLWGQAAMASSIRDRTHRLPDQKITLTHLPAQICTPHFWYSRTTPPLQNA